MDDARTEPEVRFDDLTPEELRVLGCLVEKEATTPDSYPLTLNALRNACNQSTSRDPVVDYGDHDVERALASLRARGVTRTVHSTSNRAAKYRHVLPDALGLDAADTAVIAVLMLRGPQTVGELKGRTERLRAFASIDETAATLARLADRGLARQLERRPGQKDARWIHLLAPVADDGAHDDIVEPARPGSSDSGDPYGEATAEFYDLLATCQWETFGLELLDLLDGVDPAAGPIIDLGAGTGVGLPYLRAAAPDVSILAIEPSKAMRTAMHARLAIDRELRDVVTIDPRPLAAALPSGGACAVVMSAVLGHLDDAQREILWRFVAERMPVGAPVLIELLPPHRPVEIPPTRYRSLPVGRFVYEGWQAGRPVDDRTMRWTMTYRVLDGESTVAEYEVTSDYRCWSCDDLRAEVDAHGLTVTARGEVCIVRR